MVMLLISCTSAADREFSALVEQARQHYGNADYASALTVYGKALDIKEDGEVRATYADLTTEITKMKEVSHAYDDLRVVHAKYNSVATRPSLYDVCEAVTSATQDIESIDVVGGDRPSRFIKKMRESTEFHLLKTTASLLVITHSSGIADNDEYTDGTRLMGELSNLLERFPLPDGYADLISS